MKVKGFTIRQSGAKGKFGARVYSLYAGKVDAVSEALAGRAPKFRIVAETYCTGARDAYHHASVCVYANGNYEVPVFRKGTQGFGVRTLNDSCKERTRFMREALEFIKAN